MGEPMWTNPVAETWSNSASESPRVVPESAPPRLIVWPAVNGRRKTLAGAPDWFEALTGALIAMLSNVRATTPLANPGPPDERTGAATVRLVPAAELRRSIPPLDEVTPPIPSIAGATVRLIESVTPRAFAKFAA